MHRCSLILMLSTMLLGISQTLVQADSLKSIFGSRFSANSHHGRDFGTRLHGGRNIEARLGVHALRRHQALQEYGRDRVAPYALRYRLRQVGNGRALWPNGEVALRGGPTFQGAKAACHRVGAVKSTATGGRVRIAGTRCYDDYGQPHVIDESVRIIDQW